MEISLRLYALINKLLNFLITPFLIFIFGKQKRTLPKHDDPILEICAVDLAEKIRNREVSLHYCCPKCLNCANVYANELSNRVIIGNFICSRIADQNKLREKNHQRLYDHVWKLWKWNIVFIVETFVKNVNPKIWNSRRFFLNFML